LRSTACSSVAHSCSNFHAPPFPDGPLPRSRAQTFLPPITGRTLSIPVFSSLFPNPIFLPFFQRVEVNAQRALKEYGSLLSGKVPPPPPAGPPPRPRWLLVHARLPSCFVDHTPFSPPLSVFLWSRRKTRVPNFLNPNFSLRLTGLRFLLKLFGGKFP